MLWSVLLDKLSSDFARESATTTNTLVACIYINISAHVALKALGLGELVDCPEYATNSARMKNREAKSISNSTCVTVC